MTYPTLDRREFRREQAERAVAAFPRRYRDAVATEPRVLSWTTRVIASPVDAPSLLLAGPTGVGKTYEAYGAIRAIKFGLADRGHGLTAAWTTHAALNDRLRPAADNSHRHALEPYETAELLLFDDVAAGLSTEWTLDALYRLVDARWAEMRPTIFTTNLPAGQMVDAIGDRLLSRITGMSTTVVLAGADRRQAS